MNLSSKIMAVVFSVIVFAAFVMALDAGIDKSEKAECLKWRQEASEFPLWYSADWQREQCKAQGLPLPK
jgi:hypothetical protein